MVDSKNGNFANRGAEWSCTLQLRINWIDRAKGGKLVPKTSRDERRAHASPPCDLNCTAPGPGLANPEHLAALAGLVSREARPAGYRLFLSHRATPLPGHGRPGASSRAATVDSATPRAAPLGGHQQALRPKSAMPLLWLARAGQHSGQWSPPTEAAGANCNAPSVRHTSWRPGARLSIAVAWRW
jgi:hypothetical protein